MRLPVRAPYVLDCDAASLADRRAGGGEDHRVHTEVLPEPFVGAFSAPVVLLALNPGFSDDDTAVHARPEFRMRLLANLHQEPMPFPFYPLDPALDCPARRWWERTLAALLREVPREVVARRVQCIEYFGYHSRRFTQPRSPCESQRYAFHLLRRAMMRGAMVVVLRGARLWFAAVPRLRAYERLAVLRN
ncbi:MAG: hypothetical protein JNK15_08295, partial [Planctomycetes bacterium]|nr:hypothetical protein [Planctomycetota bacterium]